MFESGYGAPRAVEAMGRPVPVPLCAETDMERARMVARVVIRANGAIATGNGFS